MTATIPFNPSVTSNSAGTFNISTEGYVQGTALNDPTVRNLLAGGIWSSSETVPAFGGMAIAEYVPTYGTTSPLPNLGSVVARATSSTGILGFSVFDQAYGMVNTPQSPVPLAASGMQVNFYRIGSGARIAVACDPVLASLEGGLVNAANTLAWDYANQKLVPYESVSISSATYTTGTGVLTLTMASNPGVSIGDTVVLSALTGTGSYASLNGSWQVITGTTGTTLVVQATAGLTAAVTGGTASTGAALTTLKVLDLSIGNSMTVSYSSSTGFATWNYSGSTAIILI